MVYSAPGAKGSVSVIDFATRKIIANWPIPGGGSPDMGNVSADGKVLWLSGRFDDMVYAIDTTTGAVRKIKVGTEPHGLTVWPQPGRYSLGHTGNLRYYGGSGEGWVLAMFGGAVFASGTQWRAGSAGRHI
jgi:DNA-binding beta-propeller fold protein YncE